MWESQPTGHRRLGGGGEKRAKQKERPSLFSLLVFIKIKIDYEIIPVNQPPSEPAPLSFSPP